MKVAKTPSYIPGPMETPMRASHPLGGTHASSARGEEAYQATPSGFPLRTPATAPTYSAEEGPSRRLPLSAPRKAYSSRVPYT